MKQDKGQQLTDELLKEYEAKISKEYRKAVAEAQAKLDDYLRRFAVKDEAWQRMVAGGVKTAKEYAAWRQQQIMVGRNWEKLKNELSEDYHNANVTARKLVEQMRAGVYAENVNFGTFEVEKAARIDSSFTLYNRETVEKIIREQPELLPPPGLQMQAKLFAGKDIAWQAGQIQSVTLQSILQGESIPNMTKRIAREMGDANHKSTIRYARTACTCAENAGRQDAYHRAEELGVDMQRGWRSVWDGRTRYEHRQLDGQVRGIEEPFEVDGIQIMFPGDPTAPGFMVWNCRCRTRALVKGLEPQARKYRSNDIEGKTYEEWKNSHEERSDPIEKQERIAEAMKWRTIRELYGGNGGGSGENWRDMVKPEKPQEPTIAGVQRGEPMTHSEADTGKVNPHFSEGGGYKINCQSCVATYEARLRGYNVEAVPNDTAHPMCRKLASDTRIIWKNKDGTDAQFAIGSNNWTWKGAWDGSAPTAKKFEKKLLETLDQSGRYTVQFTWRGFNSGHIVNIENDAGTLVIYDPQSDKTMRGNQVSDYLARMKYSRQYKGHTYYQWPGVMRVDNKDFNFDIANHVMRKAGD